MSDGAVIDVRERRCRLVTSHLVPKAEERPAQQHQHEKNPENHPGTQRQFPLVPQVVFVFVQ